MVTPHPFAAYVLVLMSKWTSLIRRDICICCLIGLKKNSNIDGENGLLDVLLIFKTASVYNIRLFITVYVLSEYVCTFYSV
jgi:hypothetical protein